LKENENDIKKLNKQLETEQEEYLINLYKNIKSIEKISQYISLIWLPIIIESAKN
jgi:hypothetical protein